MRYSVVLNLLFLAVTGTLCFAAEETATKATPTKASESPLFDFNDANADQWQIINDGVMGGLSSSKAELSDDGHMRFSGKLSLENNGGFASVRSKPKELDINTGDSIKLRVKGDGRKYTFNLYVPTQRIAFSYQQDFETKADQSTEITLPLDKFQATSFGRPVSDQPLDPAEVNSVGILLGDKKAGPFELVVDWIRVAEEE